MAEMERQVKFMNKSIVGLKENASDSERKSKVYMHKKTLENNSLIGKLTRLRNDIKNLKSENDLLAIKLQKHQAALPQRVVSARHTAPRPALPSKGKLFKGTPFQYKKFNYYEKQRISELQVSNPPHSPSPKSTKTRRSSSTRI